VGCTGAELRVKRGTLIRQEEHLRSKRRHIPLRDLRHGDGIAGGECFNCRGHRDGASDAAAVSAAHVPRLLETAWIRVLILLRRITWNGAPTF